VTLCRFFKWLYYPDASDPKRRNELSTLEKKPDCIIGIKQLKRKDLAATNLQIYGHRKMIYYF
jgi:hypothetical protein